MKKIISLLLTVMLLAAMSIPAFGASYDSTDAGEYGLLEGEITGRSSGNTRYIYYTTQCENEAPKLITKYEVQNNDTGSTFKKDTITRRNTAYMKVTIKATNPSCDYAAWGTHEIRGRRSYMAQTSTVIR